MLYEVITNNLAKDFALSAIVSEGLGQDNYTDVLSLTFTANEYIGNLYGPLSVITSYSIHYTKLYDVDGIQNITGILSPENYPVTSGLQD